MDKPSCLTQDHLDYLDRLRDSGKTNMFVAEVYLLEAFPEINRNESQAVLIYWMDTFSDRHSTS